MRTLALGCLLIVAAACSSSARRSAGGAGLGPRLNCPPGAHMEGSLLLQEGGSGWCFIPRPPGLQTPWPFGPTVPHGPHVRYWQNGKLQEDSVYDLGHRVGYKSYWENGNPQSQWDYKGREMVRVRDWFEDGALQRDAWLRNDGLPVGTERIWTDDPERKAIVKCWVDGRPIWLKPASEAATWQSSGFGP